MEHSTGLLLLPLPARGQWRWRESFDPIDFIFAEEIENIKGAILSSARAAGGTHGLLEEGGKAKEGEGGREPNPRRQ